MLEYRCRNLHPKYETEECGELLARDYQHSFIGELELWCKKCRSRSVITAGDVCPVMQVDSSVILV